MSPIERPGAGTLEFLRDDLVWLRAFTAARRSPVPALFLDRDGVIIEERHYVSRPAGVQLIEGAAAVIAGYRKAGWAVVVITNQSGIGRGLFDWHAYSRVEDRLLEMLAGEGAAVDMILACPHHPSGGKAPYGCDHPWRKPAPGMILEACERLNLDLARSMLVGDKASDIEAARRARLAGAVHVATGHGERERAAALALAGPGFAVSAAASIAGLKPGMR